MSKYVLYYKGDVSRHPTVHACEEHYLDSVEDVMTSGSGIVYFEREVGELDPMYRLVLNTVGGGVRVERHNLSSAHLGLLQDLYNLAKNFKDV